ncbi:hypothetical protein PybrP1_004585, partial [[Pythium] brassicae (nom. inval.)]
DEVQLENVAHMFVRNTIAKLETHEHHARRVVDLSRWKLVKRRDGVSVYTERCAVGPARRWRRRGQSHAQLQQHGRRRLDDHDRFTDATAASSSQYVQETESTAATDSPASGDSSPTSVGLFLKGYMSLPSTSTLVRAITDRVAARSVLSVCKYVEWGRTKKLVFALEQLYKCPVERIRDSSGGSGGDARNNNNDDDDDYDDDSVGGNLGDAKDHRGGVSSGCNNNARNGDISPNRTSACTNCKKRARSRHRIFHRRSTCRPKCKLCLQYVCASCLIKKTLGYIAADGQLQYNEVTLCALCIHVAMIQTGTAAVASQEVARSMELLRLSPPPPLKSIVTTSSMAVSDHSLFDHATPW